MTEFAWQEVETKLRAYVRRRVDGAHADDVLGDILLRLVRSREKTEGARNPMAWVYRVAANAIADHYRKVASERRTMESVRHEASGDDATKGASNDPGSAALAQCLTPMMRNLPAPYDEALLLTEVEGLSQVAAAERLGLSVSGMKSRVQRGRKKLKDALLRCCEIELNRRGDVLDYQARSGRECGGSC